GAGAEARQPADAVEEPDQARQVAVPAVPARAAFLVEQRHRPPPSLGRGGQKKPATPLRWGCELRCPGRREFLQAAPAAWGGRPATSIVERKSEEAKESAQFPELFAKLLRPAAARLPFSSDA